MEESDVRLTIERLIRDTFPGFKKPLLDSTVAKEVPGWDSVSHFNLLLSIEDEFEIEMDATQSYLLENVGQLIEFVVTTLRSQH